MMLKLGESLIFFGGGSTATGSLSFVCVVQGGRVGGGAQWGENKQQQRLKMGERTQAVCELLLTAEITKEELS
jgi:hypothetical protein